METIVPISARLIANKANSKFKQSLIAKVTESLQTQLKAEGRI